MNMRPSPKIIGAFVVGLAMVAGAYTVSNFGAPTGNYSAVGTAPENQAAAPIRSAITVTDDNNNGIEDWRDEFVTTEPLVIDGETTPEYEPPSTLTGQIGVEFFEDFVESKRYGALGGGQDQLIQNTIVNLERETSHDIYDTPDIAIMNDWSETDVRTYANAVANAILIHSESDLDHELLILNDILNRNDTERFSELETIAEKYRLTKEAIVEIPVPVLFTKQHLDLINTLHAIHNDILGMTFSLDDPAYSILRLKRYQDDVLGMQIALENFYLSIEPYAVLFDTEDPAVFFTQFSPTNRIRI